MTRSWGSVLCAVAVLVGCGSDLSNTQDDTGVPLRDSGAQGDTGTPPDQDATMDLDTSNGPAGDVGPTDDTPAPPPDATRDAGARDTGSGVDVPIVTITPPGSESCSDLHTSLMCPGHNCLACHRSGGAASGRIWTAAGTIYNSPTAAIRSGLAGVAVTLTDSTGHVVNLTTNSVGNFYTNVRLAYPISVHLGMSGRTAMMTDRTMYGGCNACHTVPPNVGAPGRAYIGP